MTPRGQHRKLGFCANYCERKRFFYCVNAWTMHVSPKYTMKSCIHCGQLFLENTNFCANCGKVLCRGQSAKDEAGYAMYAHCRRTDIKQRGRGWFVSVYEQRRVFNLSDKKIILKLYMKSLSTISMSFLASTKSIGHHLANQVTTEVNLHFYSASYAH